MSEIAILTSSFLAGAVLGTIFFGGLWWTIRVGLGSKTPAIWFLGSFGLRTATALLGFYFVSHGDWRNALACLLGFFAARVGTTWLPSPTAASAS
jgi:F1F0 ATPase subunit 2